MAFIRYANVRQRTMKIAYAPKYTHPLPEGHRFPMDKYMLLAEQLLYEGTAEERDFFEPSVLHEKAILWTHEVSYWEKLKLGKLSKIEERKIGFPYSAGLIERERRIAQGTIDNCFHAVREGIALNIAGGTHHAYTGMGSGFCLLNDQAIAANYLLHEKLAGQILIIDLDVHQGDGTAQIFQNEPRVFTFSMHGQNNFPMKKQQSDLDVALKDQTDDVAYLSILYKKLDYLFPLIRPDFVFYLSGVDVLATDRLGRLGLSKAGCMERDQAVFERCHDLKIPVSVSMGGGYSKRLADIVDAHANTFRLAKKIFS